MSSSAVIERAVKIVRKRLSEEIAEAVQQKIVALGLQQGDRLPSHASLATELSVSIPSLREGLQFLATLGVLRIDHGVGTIVAEPSVSSYFRILNSVLRAKPHVREEYLELRRLLEPWTARQAAERGNRSPQIRDSMEMLKTRASSKDIDAFIEEALRFHRRIYRLAGNTVIAEVLNVVNRIFYSDPGVRQLIAEHLEGVLRDYQVLMQAIQQTDGGRAEKSILDLLSRLGQRPRVSIVYDTFCTGSIGGSFYSAGRELCRVLNLYGGMSIESEPSGGGIENVELTAEGHAILGLTQSDVAYHAFHGTGPFFEPHTQIRAVCGAHNLDLWIVAGNGTGIRTLEDLRGKRIALGATGGETSIIAKALLGAHGIKEGEFRPFYLSISNAVQGLRTAKIDCLFYLTNGPGSALADLSGNADIRIIGVDPVRIEAVRNDHPYWHPSVIRRSVWAVLDADIPTLGTPALLITHKDVPREVVRNITAAIMEHADAVNFNLSDGSPYGLDSALRGISIPLHPGAETYYRERGLLSD